MRDTTQKQLFTHTLPQDMQAIIRGIAAEDVESITSTPSTFDKGGNGQWLQWATAWKVPGTHKWTIEKHRKFDGEGGDATIQRQTVARGACFFDALYYCGYDETSRKAMKAEMQADAIPADKMHYAEAAAAANQPLDMAGLPHPAAFGEILTDGHFGQKAYDEAAKTKGKELVVVKRQEELPTLVDFNTLGVGNVTADTQALRETRAMDKSKLKGKFEHAAASMMNLERVVERYNTHYDFIGEAIKNHSFSTAGHGYDVDEKQITNVCRIVITAGSGIGAAFINPLFIPAGLAAGHAYGSTMNMIPVFMKGSSEAWKIHSTIRKAVKAAKALPDERVRQEAFHTIHQVKATYHFQRAAEIVNDKGTASRLHVARAFRHVNKGAKLAGMSDMETAQLRQALLERKFPNTYSLASKAEKCVYSFRQMVEGVTEQIEAAESVDQLKLRHDEIETGIGRQQENRPRYL